MKRWLAIFLVLSLAAGCSEPETVTGVQLTELTKHWKEPKVAIWYYLGSDSEYHYFQFHDLGVTNNYRVKRNELSVESSFPLTKERKHWRVMPWGPQALIERKT